MNLIKSDDDYDYYSELSLEEFELAEKSLFKGKYLLFSGNHKLLLEESIQAIECSNMTSFRISKDKGGTDEFDNVSGLYDESNRYSNIIAVVLPNEITFRYWKSLYKTRNNIYSSKYLEKLK